MACWCSPGFKNEECIFPKKILRAPILKFPLSIFFLSFSDMEKVRLFWVLFLYRLSFFHVYFWRSFYLSYRLFSCLFTHLHPMCLFLCVLKTFNEKLRVSPSEKQTVLPYSPQKSTAPTLKVVTFWSDWSSNLKSLSDLQLSLKKRKLSRYPVHSHIVLIPLIRQPCKEGETDRWIQ